MQLHVSNELNRIMEQSLQLSAAQGRFYVGVEHLFCVILDHADQLPAPFWESHGNNLM